MQVSAKQSTKNLRKLRFHLRRLWKLPHEHRTSPTLFGIILLTSTGLGLTLTSWIMVRLLPSIDLIRSLASEFPAGFFGLLHNLPELLRTAPPSTTVFSEVLVSQTAYIITYVWGTATIFCLVLLLLALLRRW